MRLNEKEIEGLTRLQEERQNREREFHQQLLFVACTLLGLLATLGIRVGNDSLGTCLQASLYISLPLSILLELTALLWTKRSAILLEKKTKEALILREDGKPYEIPFVKKPIIVFVAEYLGIVFFVASLVLLSALQLKNLSAFPYFS